MHTYIIIIHTRVRWTANGKAHACAHKQRRWHAALVTSSYNAQRHARKVEGSELMGPPSLRHAHIYPTPGLQKEPATCAVPAQVAVAACNKGGTGWRLPPNAATGSRPHTTDTGHSTAPAPRSPWQGSPAVASVSVSASAPGRRVQGSSEWVCRHAHAHPLPALHSAGGPTAARSPAPLRGCTQNLCQCVRRRSQL